MRGLIEQGELNRPALAARNARAAGFEALAGRLDAELEAGARRSRSLQMVEQAMAQLRAGQNEEARATLLRATETDPGNGQTWLILADRLRLSGDLDGAEGAIERGARGAEPALRADAANLHGMVEIARQRLPAAVEHFREAQRIAPAMPRSYLLEARAWLAGGNREGAVEALRRGLQVLPGNPLLTGALSGLGPSP